MRVYLYSKHHKKRFVKRQTRKLFSRVAWMIYARACRSPRCSDLFISAVSAEVSPCLLFISHGGNEILKLEIPFVCVGIDFYYE